LGVVVTTIADPFAAEVVQGIEEAANARGYSLVLATSSAHPDREMAVVHQFEERRVDGILVMSSRVGNLYLPHLAQMQVPVVLINNQHPGEFAHAVMIDNVAASRTAMHHLLDLGHRRIAYLGDRGGFQSDAERLAAYREALESRNIPFEQELVLHADSTPEGAMAAMEQIFSLPVQPTAVFCYNDITAMGVLRAARLRSIRVPEDLSVMGFDDLQIASYLHPTLTTVRQPKQQMGREATGLLFDLLGGSPVDSSRRVPGELVVRESTGRPKS
jgi:DNA-binding LacI/PurR family transcriptional regulator